MVDHEMKHISWDPAEKRIVVTDDRTFGRDRALHAEQEGVVRTKDVIQKFRSLENTVVVPYVDIGDTGKTCALLPSHLRFVERKIDTIWFKELLPGFVMVFVRQTLNEETYIIEEAYVQDAAMKLVPAVDIIINGQRKLLWDASHDLCPTQSFPAHITHSLSNHFWDP